MDLRIEPSSLSMSSRIVLGTLLLLNLVLALYLLFSEPDAEQPRGTDATFTEDQKIVLIKELEVAELEDRAKVSEAPRRVLNQSAPALASRELSCQAWGPFANSETLDPVVAAVSALDPALRVIETEIEVAPDFLVYLSSDDNPDNARRMLQELESQGIEAYVIAGGEYLNAVSAGVFSNRDGAEQVQNRLADLGYAAAVEPLVRSQAVSYLMGRVPEGFSLDDLSSRPCTEIAQLQEFL